MTAHPFTARVDGRTRMVLQGGVACLAVLGMAQASEAWSPVFAVWALGRTPWTLAVAPRVLTAALGFTTVLYLAGIRARSTGLAACALMAMVHTLVPATYHNNYYLLFLLLGVTAAGAAPDYRPGWFLRADTDPGTAPAVVTTLVRAQLVIVYLGSVAVKLTHPWWQGTGGVIYWLATRRVPDAVGSSLDGAPGGPGGGWWHVPLRVVVGSPHRAALADTLITATEVLLPMGLLTRRRRRLALGVGAVMHTVMQEWLFPQLFTFLMLLGYYAFVPSGDRAWRVGYRPAHPVESWLARWYPRIDWLARTCWEPREDARGMSAAHPDGTAVTGLSVMRLLTVLSPVPLLAWAALSLCAPGTRTVFTLPRQAVENTLAAAVLLAFIPVERWMPDRWSQSPPHGRKSSHPA